MTSTMRSTMCSPVALRLAWSSACRTVPTSAGWASGQVDPPAQRSSMSVRPYGRMHDREVRMIDLPVRVAGDARDNPVGSKRVRAGRFVG